VLIAQSNQKKITYLCRVTLRHCSPLASSNSSFSEGGVFLCSLATHHSRSNIHTFY